MKRIFVILMSVFVLGACTNNAKNEALMRQQVAKQVRDSLVLDSFRKAETAKQAQVAKVEEERRVARRVAEEKRTLLLSERNEAAQAPVVYQEAAPRKKGWSSAAKGTAIGAGAGALGGVLIDKKDGRGAIIGGLIGAGTGYVIGRDQDRKSGRVQPRN